MAIPWMQIVKWMPTIVQVSRDLLRRTETTAPVDTHNASVDMLAQRLLRLEENERRQAELVHQMAEQLSQVSEALLVMRRRQIWLGVALAIVGAIAVVALVLAAR